MPVAVAPDSGRRDAPAAGHEASSLVAAAAALSLSAALIHASVITAHLREYWLFGVLFIVTAVAQLAWALAIWTRPHARGLLWAGAVGNVAIALVWLLSRTSGLPIGPDAGVREPAGIHDVLATTNELMLAVLVAWVLLAPGRTGGAAGITAIAWALSAAGVLVALLGGH